MPSTTLPKFKKGDSVMAKWPGTSLHYPGKVVDLNDTEYLVQLEGDEDSEIIVKYKDVTAPFKRRSSSRGRSPSRRSPSRRSPSRKSPARKSPGRKKKEENNIAKVNSEEPRQLRARKSADVSIPPPRQSARLAEKATTETPKTNDIKPSVVIKPSTTSKVGSIISKFMGCLLPNLKALPMFAFIIAGTFLFNQLCTKKKCSITQLPVLPKDYKSYFDLKATLIVLGYIVVQTLLSFIPIGKVVKSTSGVNLRMNAYIVLLLNLIAIPICLHFKVDILVSYQLYRQIIVTLVLLGSFLGVVLFIKSRNAKSINPDGNTGHFLPDFIEGREINPTIGPIEVKYLVRRLGFLTIILMNLIIIIKDHQTKNTFSPTLIMSASLQILYFIDFLWFEESYLTTYEYVKIGTGFMVTVGYLSASFYALIIPRYVMNHRDEIKWYYLIGIASLNCLGYIIMRCSNSQKHAFRSNPSDPALAHLETIPTAAGTRLLVSGWWGVVRHPNYIGDIFIQLSWGLLCGFNHALPWVIVGLIILNLIVRMYTVEASCKAKYRVAWDSYTSRIKYKLIPRVF